MPTPSFSLDINTNLSMSERIKNLENSLYETTNRLNWILSKLDSKNVKRLSADVIVSGQFDSSLISIDENTTFATGFDPTALTNSLGDLAYEDLVEATKLGTTIIQGGIIKTDLMVSGAALIGLLGVNTLSAITANLGTVTAGSLTTNTTINVGTDATVGNNLYMGNQGSYVGKTIRFNNMAYIQASLDMELRAENIDLHADTDVEINGWACLIHADTRIYEDLRVDGTCNFIGTVSGLSTSTGGAHNHGIANGTMLALASGGSVMWVASSGHSNHTIS